MLPAVILFLESLGGGELLVILLFVLLFFGSKNIPNLARGLGKGIREFKDAMNGVQSEIRQGMYDVEKVVKTEEDKIPPPAAGAEQLPAPEETPAPTTPVVAPEERSAAR